MSETILITGAGAGIGAACALLAAQKGYNIVLNYRSAEPAELISQLRSLGAAVEPVKADVSDFEQASGLVKQAVSVFGGIDVLINNAGITRDNLLLRMSEDDFDEVLKVNLKGAFNMLKHASGVMLKKKRGCIINISSVVGLMGNAGQANYAASKAGLVGLTKSAAKELGSRGITVNAIAPGFIETAMTDKLPEEIKSRMLESIPLARFGAAEEIANAAFFLAGAKYITGQVLVVDGGMCMV